MRSVPVVIIEAGANASFSVSSKPIFEISDFKFEIVKSNLKIKLKNVNLESKT
jgi:hypothetical protein